MPDHLPYSCKILKVLLSKHGYGSPIQIEAIVNLAAVPVDDLDVAAETADEMRTSREFSFVENHGREHIQLNNSEFPAMVDYLLDGCGWSKTKVDGFTRHYDVSKHHG